MKKSRFTETQIVAILKDADAGIKVEDLCRKNGGITEPGKPWQNGSNESFTGTFRNECLNAEIFESLLEAQVVIEQWRKRYNAERPHSTQNYITPDMAYLGLRSQ